MCLLEGKHAVKCNHKKCWEVENYPQYNISKKTCIDTRTDFSSFRIMKRGTGSVLVAVNPYPAESAARSEFKKFASRMVLPAFGDWPADQNIIDRQLVHIQYVQYAAFKYKHDHLTNKRVKKWSIDLKEAAVYVHSPEGNQFSN